ncbi:MAG: cytochrome c oxidase assembly protein, partial [Thiomonas delicata]
PPAHIRPGGRIFLPILAMIPQMVLGAVLALTSADWYPIYTLCGRAISGIEPLTDQHLGGLILWIPASGLNVIAAMVALRNWMRLSERGRLQEKARRPRPGPSSDAKPSAAA